LALSDKAALTQLDHKSPSPYEVITGISTYPYQLKFFYRNHRDPWDGGLTLAVEEARLEWDFSKNWE